MMILSNKIKTTKMNVCIADNFKYTNTLKRIFKENYNFQKLKSFTYYDTRFIFQLNVICILIRIDE